MLCYSPELPLQCSDGMRENKSKNSDSLAFSLFPVHHVVSCPPHPPCHNGLKPWTKFNFIFSSCLAQMFVTVTEVTNTPWHSYCEQEACEASCDILSASSCLPGVHACRFLNAKLASSELIWSNTYSSTHPYNHDKAAAILVLIKPQLWQQLWRGRGSTQFRPGDFCS